MHYSIKVCLWQFIYLKIWDIAYFYLNAVFFGKRFTKISLQVYSHAPYSYPTNNLSDKVQILNPSMVLIPYGLSEKSKDVSFSLLGVDLIFHVPTLYRSRTSVVILSNKSLCPGCFFLLLNLLITFFFFLPSVSFDSLFSYCFWRDVRCGIWQKIYNSDSY